MSGALTGEWSRLLATSLAQAGLEHAVICPGSRSTPFAWALAETRGLRCHVLIDERAAAFFALGLARVTGHAALVLCTSGTAAANFFPAVVEASLARLPLLVLTADRPPELQAADAAQTIDQVKLYGAHAREFFDLGAPEPSPNALAGLRRIAMQALGATLAPVPGPVHLNARARKPLEPTAAENDADRRVSEAVSALIARGAPRVVTAERALAATDVAKLGRALAESRRGLVVCGPLPAHSPGAARAVRSLAERLGMPLFAEATSGVRFDEEPDALTADAFDLLMRSRECRERLAPDCVVRLGGTPTSSGLEVLLGENPEAALHVIAEHGHPDALGRAQSVTVGPVEAVTGALLAVLARHEPTGEQRAFAGKIGYANA
ncbi:MAG TPA: 2-succinyl-5-enolpyruvyl-6-hydroxy-3-cyclohexene-1-carboxylic-acid synthase, partial [Polyangiaceae bacterium]|nr:2-succinyl-5-enolpyruvyl-6-hydroxy-3-cyclohexene-1-carboxylic-acid synthase [Polyangiaceae bacterium]